MNYRILLVLPAFQEEGKIGKVVEKAKNEKLITEILVVDDGSNDLTKTEAEKSEAKVIRHEQRKGVGAAIRTGIEYALSNNFDVVVVMGGDDQDNPAEIPLLLKPIIEDGFDFVQGSRYLNFERTKDIPLFRKITTKFYSFLFKKFTGFSSSDATNGFRAFRTKIFQNKQINLNQNWLNTYELEPYLFYKTIKLGFKITEAPVTKIYHKDKSFTKMKPIIDWWRILRPIIFLKLRIKK